MYKPGQWHAHCDVCGFKYYSGEMKQRWDGLMVCAKDWEPDHPQKYLRIPTDTQSVPWVREQSDDLFLEVCYLWERSGYADLATAGCAQAGNTAFTYPFLLGLKNG